MKSLVLNVRTDSGRPDRPCDAAANEASWWREPVQLESSVSAGNRDPVRLALPVGSNAEMPAGARTDEFRRFSTIISCDLHDLNAPLSEQKAYRLCPQR